MKIHMKGFVHAIADLVITVSSNILIIFSFCILKSIAVVKYH